MLEGDAEVVRQGIGLVGVNVFCQSVIGGLPLRDVVSLDKKGELGQDSDKTNVVITVRDHVTVGKYEES